MNFILNWFSVFFDYLMSDIQDLFVGGVIVVGVVIVLMGALKSLKPIKTIKNDTFRKVLLAWLSIILTVGLTTLSVYLNEFKEDHFWALCIVNSIGTVLIYWVYENTAVRNFVEWVGKHTIIKLLTKKPKTIDEVKKLNEDINHDTECDIESLLSFVESESLPHYKDDDLKTL